MFCRTIRGLRPVNFLRVPAEVAAPISIGRCQCISAPSAVIYTSRSFHSTPQRCKSYSNQDKSDVAEELEWDPSLSRDSKLVKFHTTSMRMDILLKSALAISRNKIEKIFYESKIRLNGKKVMKKSTQVRVGDEIDVIKMLSPKNPEHLFVSRVEIVDATAQEESILVTARRFKSLLIENYQEDPHQPSSSESNN